MREYLKKIVMAVKKVTKKVVVKAVDTPVFTPVTQKTFVKGPHHIVKDGEIILDPNFVNPGVFSSNA